MRFYSAVIRPVLFLFSPEVAHKITFFLLRAFGVLLPIFIKRRRRVEPVELFGLTFPHRVGLAAGLDKEGHAYNALSKLGFAFVEVGTVTPRGQAGNSKPRLFRLTKDQGLINRMGFNNAGVEQLAGKLRKIKPDTLIGGNIGKNTTTPNEAAVGDYLHCFEKLYNLVDYFVVNVSCPNISDLRELQDKDNLSTILAALIEYRKHQGLSKPILLKVSPDLNENQLDDLIGVVKAQRLDGLVATNTTISRQGLTTDTKIVEQIGKGGLSGRPLNRRSTEVIRHLRKQLGPEFPIIASGGIMTAEDAEEKITAGADLVQLYTGFIYRGPGLINEILQKLG